MDFKAKAKDLGWQIAEAWDFCQGSSRGDPMLAQALREAYEQGRRDENEACAKIVESKVEYLSKDPNYMCGYENLIRGLLVRHAEEIRERMRHAPESGEKD